MTGYDIGPRKRPGADYLELYDFRELFFLLAWRDIKVKYKQTFLGFLWVILQPLALMLIFSVVWQKIVKYGPLDIPYNLFAYSGLILWSLFSSGINSAGESMISNANLVKKIYFPRIIVPAAALLTALFDFIMTFSIYIILIFYYSLDLNIIRFSTFTLCAVCITLAASYGVGLIIASTTAKYRDFRYIVPFLLQAMFFITPVIYPIKIYQSEILRFILSLNPLAGAIELIRSALTNNPVDASTISLSCLVTLIIMAGGHLSFRGMETHFADLL